MNTPTVPVAVPTGERLELQHTAQETGERFGRMDAQINEHGRQLDRVHDSMKTMADAMARSATDTAVIAGSVKEIEGTLDLGLRRIDGRLTDTEAFVSEQRGGGRITERRQSVAIQWQLAILAAFVALFGTGMTVVLTIAILIANGKL